MNTASETMNRESFDAQLESLGIDEQTIYARIMRETIRGAFFLQEILDLLSVREREELGITDLNLLEEFSWETLSVNHRKQRRFLEALRRAHERDLMDARRLALIAELFMGYSEAVGRLNGATKAMALNYELSGEKTLDDLEALDQED